MDKPDTSQETAQRREEMAAAGVVTVEVRETSHATAVVDEVTYQEIVAQEVETAVVAAE